MEFNDRLLISILAAQDALWLPMRKWKHPRPGNTSIARRRFPTAGVHFSVGGGTAERKAGSEAMIAMAAAGLVKMDGKTRSTAVRLSDEAEDRARALAGLPRFAKSIKVLCRLGELTTLARTETFNYRDDWINEANLADAKWEDAEALMDLEDALLPALSRGIVKAHSTCSGHVAYRLMTPSPTGTRPKSVRFGIDDDAGLWYYDERARHDFILVSRDRSGGDIGGHPLALGVGIWEPAGTNWETYPDHSPQPHPPTNRKNAI